MDTGWQFSEKVMSTFFMQEDNSSFFPQKYIRTSSCYKWREEETGDVSFTFLQEEIWNIIGTATANNVNVFKKEFANGGIQKWNERVGEESAVSEMKQIEWIGEKTEKKLPRRIS